MPHYEPLVRATFVISRIDQEMREMATGLPLTKVLNIPGQPPVPASNTHVWQGDDRRLGCGWIGGGGDYWQFCTLNNLAPGLVGDLQFGLEASEKMRRGCLLCHL